MTKIILNVILAVSLFFSLFLGLNADNVTATVDGTVTTKTQVINIEIKNGTRSTIGLSGSILVTAIEQKIDGEWVEIGHVDSIPEDAMSLYPTFKTTETFNIKRFGIEHLSVGEYRFVVPYSCDGRRTAYAYFSVAE